MVEQSQTGSADRQPLVSICIASYNAEGFISKTLDSVLAQSHSHLQIIVSDDASTDNTLATCEAYAKSDRRFEIYSNAERIGWVGNINRALERVLGTYLTILGHDDVLRPDYVSELVMALQSNPDAVLAFSGMVMHRLNGARACLTWESCDHETTAAGRATAMIAREGCWWVAYRGLLPVSVYKAVGGLRAHAGGEVYADFPWLFRLALAGKFVRIQPVLYHKYAKKKRLAASWGRSPGNWVPVYRSLFAVVLESSLPLKEAFPVYLALCGKLFECYRLNLKHRLGALVPRRHQPLV